MRFEPIEITDKLGRRIVLRSAEPSDADALIQYLKITSGETRFLLREPDEVRFTTAQEEVFIRNCTTRSGRRCWWPRWTAGTSAIAR